MKKPRSKLLFWVTLIVFSVPVLLASLVVPKLFGLDSFLTEGSVFGYHSKELDGEKYARARFSEALEPAEGESSRSAPTFVTVANDPVLDPSRNRNFLVTFTFRLKSVPKDSYRRKLVTKYESSIAPYAGWGIALRQQAGTLRPEVYWRGSNKLGGWYSFGELKLLPSRSYTLSMLSEGSKTLSVFIQQVEDAGLEESGPRYLGGYEVDEVAVPTSSGGLLLGAPLGNKGRSQIEISNVVVASLPSSASQEGDEDRDLVSKYLNDSLENLVAKLNSENVHLWIDSEGNELSGSKRDLLISKR